MNWTNSVRFERANMVDAGLLRPDSPQGIGDLTEEGRKQHKAS